MSVHLESVRLILRPPRPEDAADFIPLLGNYDIAKNLSRIPHPYTEEDARGFFVMAADGWTQGTDFPFVVRRRGDDILVGMCGVHPARDWEIGYWIGAPFWGSGYATEAAERAIAFAFEERRAPFVKAKWFHDNLASGRVLKKLGFRPDGEEMSNCMARGHQVPAHVVVLDRETYRARKNGL